MLRRAALPLLAAALLAGARPSLAQERPEAAAAPPTSAAAEEQSADAPPPRAGAADPDDVPAAREPRDEGPAAEPLDPTEPPAEPPSPEPPESPFDDPEDTWLDVGHAFVERRIFAPVIRLDRFFSDERELEAERARSFLRVRGELRYPDVGRPVLGASIRANLRMPGLNEWFERLRIVIAGEAEDAGSALFPTEDRRPGGAASPNRADAELRYGIWQGLLSRLDLGAGVRVALPPDLFTRVRFRASIPVGRVFLTRFATSGFWRTDTGFGARTIVDLERPLGSATLARLSASAERTERSRGLEWASEAALLRAFDLRRAISVGAGLSGAEIAPVGVDVYRIAARYRRDVWRKWIFAELEPEVSWPWDPVRGRHRVLAAIVRLEVQFQGNEPPLPPPTGFPEPADPPERLPEPERSR